MTESDPIDDALLRDRAPASEVHRPINGVQALLRQGRAQRQARARRSDNPIRQEADQDGGAVLLGLLSRQLAVQIAMVYVGLFQLLLIGA